MFILVDCLVLAEVDAFVWVVVIPWIGVFWVLVLLEFVCLWLLVVVIRVWWFCGFCGFCGFVVLVILWFWLFGWSLLDPFLAVFLNALRSFMDFGYVCFGLCYLLLPEVVAFLVGLV